MMREFIGSDGRVWRARLDEQAAGGAAWELVLFEADGSQVTQRIEVNNRSPACAGVSLATPPDSQSS